MSEKDIHNIALTSLEEVNEEELDTIIGGKHSGAVPTVSHECNMNSWQFIFTCCA